MRAARSLLALFLVLGSGVASGGDPEGADGDRFSVEASLRRRALEKRLNAAAERLVGIRQEIRSVENTRLEGRDYALVTERDVAEAANFQGDKAERLRVLREAEKDTIGEIDAVRSDFDQLRAEVAERHGGTPPIWWRDTLACPRCPGRGTDNIR